MTEGGHWRYQGLHEQRKLFSKKSNTKTKQIFHRGFGHIWEAKSPWNDVFVLIQAAVAVGGGSASFDEITRDFSKEDKKKLVKIVCKVNGIKYEDEKWKKSAGKVNATQVKIAVSKVLGVKIDI